jgi:hypothetical protein
MLALVSLTELLPIATIRHSWNIVPFAATALAEIGSNASAPPNWPSIDPTNGLWHEGCGSDFSSGLEPPHIPHRSGASHVAVYEGALLATTGFQTQLVTRAETRAETEQRLCKICWF